MAKQSIVRRFFNLFRGSANDLLDQLEKPEQALNQQMRDFADKLGNTETAVAATIGGLRMMEEDQKHDLNRYATINEKAASAMNRSKVAEEKGDLETAANMKDLAKNLLTEQLDVEASIASRNESITKQTSNVETMKKNLVTLKQEYNKAERRKNELLARANMVSTQEAVNKAIAEANGVSPLSEMGRIEARIRQSEGVVLGQQELTTGSAMGQIGILDALDANDEVERRMAALSNGETLGGPKSLTMNKS